MSIFDVIFVNMYSSYSPKHCKFMLTFFLVKLALKESTYYQFIEHKLKPTISSDVIQ